MRAKRSVNPEDTVGGLIGRKQSAPPYPTPLIQRCEEAMRTPLKNLTVEQVRLLIGQGLGLEILMPRAINLLEQYPLASGDFFDGDLLIACMRAPASFWTQHEELWISLNAVLEEIDRVTSNINKHRPQFHASNPYGAA